MIPESSIQAWREFAPWGADYQVEQDLVLTRALIELYNDPLLKETFAFRGGTALQKLFYDSPKRYSEDIDLVQIRPGATGPAIDRIRKLLDSWLGKPNRAFKKARVTLIYRFQSEIPPIQRMRLKIEINTDEQFTVLGLHEKEIVSNNPWFTGQAQVVTYEIEELLGTKLRALFQRKKGRDLFDMMTALESFSNLDVKKMIECFQRYLAHEGVVITRAQFEANLAEKLEDPAFMNDSRPLMAPGSPHFEPRVAAEKIGATLLTKLPGDPWKGKNTK
jgi:predicted nucleotidyltransferase component of viral defense system